MAQALAVHQVDAILHRIPWSDLLQALMTGSSQAGRDREAVTVRCSEWVFVLTRVARSLSRQDEWA